MTTCIECDGTGVDFLEIDLDTGEVITHVCQDCGGLGVIGNTEANG